MKADTQIYRSGVSYVPLCGHVNYVEFFWKLPHQRNAVKWKYIGQGRFNRARMLVDHLENSLS